MDVANADNICNASSKGPLNHCSTFQDNYRAATAKICQSVLGKADYQLGRTKVFLKDAQDLFLELERDRVLTRKILVLQVTRQKGS